MTHKWNRMRLVLPVALSLLPLSGTGLHAQDLEEILENHYREAAQEKMAGIETKVTRGRSMFSSINLESTFTLYQARPNKVRVESEYQGSRVVQTYNGDRGWIYAPGMGIPEPKELTGEELNTLINQGEFEDPLWNYKARNRTLELIDDPGKEAAFQLKLTLANGDVVYFLIDRETYLISSYITRQVMGGTENEIEVSLDDYRNVRGIPVAYRISTKMNGQVVTTVRVEKVEFNRDLDSSLFEKPAVE